MLAFTWKLSTHIEYQGTLLLKKSADGASSEINIPIGALYAGWSLQLREGGHEDWSYAMKMSTVMEPLNLQAEHFTWRAEDDEPLLVQ